MKRRLQFALAFILVAVSLGSRAQQRPPAPVAASEQMVVAANPHAAEAGIEILRAGGSAVDAAIAVQLVLSLVEPQSSGIGGGAFMLHFDAAAEPGARLTAYEGRETAPAAATPDMFLNPDGRPGGFMQVGLGGLAVGVPGVMRMFEKAHAEHGRLPWARLFEPAIELAEQGFEISPRLYYLLDRAPRNLNSRSFAALFFDANGKAWPTGHLLKNPEYAETLRLLAKEGAEAMYRGPLAERIVDAIRNDPGNPGRMTLADLRDYKAHESDPLCSPYRQWRVCGPRLPSSGGVAVQQILGMAQSFDLGTATPDGVPPVETIHIIAEASRLAFADRNFYLGDPDFVSAPVKGLLDPEYLKERASLIHLDRTMSRVEPGRPGELDAWNYAPSGPNELKSTSHFSIVDRWGNAVSMTTSVQSTFGSYIVVGGFVLNNQLTDFSFAPEAGGRPVANRVEGGKHPLSSMTPTLVLDSQGRLRLAIGSPGGTRIIGYVTQAIVGVLDLGLNVQQAVSAPHFVARYDPLELEEDTPIDDDRDALVALGHDVRIGNMNSGLHGIEIEYTDAGRVLYGGVDPRREGVALGD